MHDSRRTRLLLSVLLIVALALITVDYRDSDAGPIKALRDFGGSVFGTTERVSAAAVRPLTSLIGGSGGQSSQVSALQAQVTRLRTELGQAQLSQQQSAQLQKLLQTAGTGRYRIVAATVIAISEGYQESVTLDAGRADGITAQQTVLDADGLVGTVTAVTGHTCTVQLATDLASVVGIRLAPGGQLGWVTGAGKTHGQAGLLSLQVLGTSTVLRPGEQLVTAASVRDKPYVPGVPVGVISQVLSRDGGLTARALVRPYADLSRLGVVGIVVSPPRRSPRFAVLPPSPAPSPQPTVTVTVTPGATAPAAPAAPAGG
jgi:rod shape-determining protein MreC